MQPTAIDQRQSAVFAGQIRSYRDLPLRYADFGQCLSCDFSKNVQRFRFPSHFVNSIFNQGIASTPKKTTRTRTAMIPSSI